MDFLLSAIASVLLFFGVGKKEEGPKFSEYGRMG